MSVIFDHIVAAVIAGVLALTIARVQINVNSMMFQNQHAMTTQTDAVELARQIESDISRIGFRVTGQKILAADSTSLQFLSDIDNHNIIQTIQYRIGSTVECSFTQNANDVPLYRSVDGVAMRQNWGLTFLQFAYYDSAYHQLSTPVSSASDLARIRAIRVSFQLESAEPVYGYADTTWAAVSWGKMILPRNLNNLNY